MDENDVEYLDIIGSQIIRIGTPASRDGFGGGGGFVIEYKTQDGIVKQLVLDYDETGIWICRF